MAETAGAAFTPPGAEVLARAREALVKADPALGPLHAAVPPFAWRTRPAGLSGLCKLVVEQQVSTASAARIWARVEAGLGGITATRLLAHDAQVLLAFGLSRNKARYLIALAEAEVDGRVDFAALRGLPDEEAISALCRLMGVGRWTAETYLMFCEGRLDVFPAGDMALQEAMRRADRADVRPDQRAAYARAERWRPYRGVAAHILWGYYRAARQERRRA